MDFNLAQMLYDYYLENEIPEANLAKISESFEMSLEKLEIEEYSKVRLSDLKSEYGSLCKAAGFYNGYVIALELLRQLYFRK